MRARRRSSTATRPGSASAPMRTSRRCTARSSSSRSIGRSSARISSTAPSTARAARMSPRACSGTNRAASDRDARTISRTKAARPSSGVLGRRQPVDRREMRRAGVLGDGREHLVVAGHSAAAQTALEVVDAAAKDARERAAQVREELGPLARRARRSGAPRGARRRMRCGAAGRVRPSRRARPRPQTRPPGRPAGRPPTGTMMPISSRRKAAAREAGHLGGHLLGDAAAAARLEQHDRAVGVGSGRRRPVREERPPQVRERGARGGGRPGAAPSMRRRLRQRLHERPHGGVGGPVDLVRAATRSPRSGRRGPGAPAPGRGSCPRTRRRARAGRPRRPAAPRAARPRSPAAPAGRACRGGRPRPGRPRRARSAPGPGPMPAAGSGSAIAAESSSASAPIASAKPEKRAEACSACSGVSATTPREQQPPLHLADDRPQLAAAPEHLLEQVVERADPAARQHSPAAHQLALDGLDIEPVGHDQERIEIGVRRLQEPVKQKGDLAAVGRTEDELQRHRWILCTAPRRPRPDPASGPRPGARHRPGRRCAACDGVVTGSRPCRGRVVDTVERWDAALASSSPAASSTSRRGATSRRRSSWTITTGRRSSKWSAQSSCAGAGSATRTA